jgi:choline monooxygenase
VFDYFFADDAADADQIVKESEEVAEEDALFCQRVQVNLDAGIYDRGWLSPRHENGLADWTELYLEVVTEGGPARPIGPSPLRNPTS